MKAVPVWKLNELLDMYRDRALDPHCSEFWLALATLVGVYEEDEENPDTPGAKAP